ncbi:MAG: hypothetical protein ACTJLN_04780 [Rickettsia amblyommatis]
MQIEINSQEYKIFDVNDDLVIYTKDLNAEIACSFFSIKLNKIALASNINSQQLEQLITDFNHNELIEQDLIKVRIIGGNDSPESSYLGDIRTILNGIDNNTNMINIIGLDACKNPILLN